MRVFISYKRQDVEFARGLCHFIESCGLEPWLDVLHIPPGSAWDNEIHKGLKDSQMVVGVLTPESLASENVLDEWGYALSTQKRLILLWLRDVDEADIPHRYIRLQRIDMRQSTETGYKRLQQAFGSPVKLLETLPATEPLSDPKSDIDAPDPIPLTQRSNRSRMLEKVRTFWVDGVLKQSIHGVALLELGLQDRASAVRDPWDTVLQHVAYGDYRLPPGTHIDDIYRSLDGELLILGDPGSGKTTTLLELARDRIALAEKDETQPIPVVFNLSSWADDRKPLHEWLAAELNTKYGVPRKVAKAWVENDDLLLLLDGLDEVLLRYRDLCVQAINEFRQEHGFAHMVVCSRIVDYEALSTRLKLNGAIVIQPLDTTQVDQYLKSLGKEYQGLLEAMMLDADLHTLAETPLMLSIMTLAFRGIAAIDLPPLSSLEAQRRRLFGIYTQRMFERRTPRRFSQADIFHYLKWLAGRMVERKQSVFYIENLQIDWIAGDFSQRLYRIVGRTTFGMVGGALLGVVAGIGLLIAALLFGQTPISKETTFESVVGVVFLAIVIPSGLGGLIFALSGLQAYALEALDKNRQPGRHLVKRLGDVIATGMGLGLLCGVLLMIGVFITGFFIAPAVEDFVTFYRSDIPESMTEGTAHLYLIMKLLLIMVIIGGYTGAASVAVVFVVQIIQRQRQRRLLIETLCIAVIGVFSIFAIDFIRYGFILIPLIMLIFGIVQALAGRINDHIESADTLKWRWNRRWAFIGLLGMLGLGVCLLINPIQDQTSYTADSEVQAQAKIAAVETELQRVNARREALQTQWLAYRQNSKNFTTLEGAVTQQSILESQLNIENYRFSEYYSSSSSNGGWYSSLYSDEEWYSQKEIRRQQFIFQYGLGMKNYIPGVEGLLYESGCQPLLETSAGFMGYYDGYSDYPVYYSLYDYPYDYPVYYSPSDYGDYDSPPFTRSIPIHELPRSIQQLNPLKAQLTGEPSAPQWVKTRTHMLFCDWQAARLRGLIHYQRTNYTRAGIQEQFVSVLRITLALGLAFIVTGGVVAGLRKSETIDIRTRPNQGIRRTLQSALQIMLIFAVVWLVVGGVIGFLLSTLPEGELRLRGAFLSVLVPLGMTLGTCIGLGLGLLLGGLDAVVKHIILRLFLQRSRSIPSNYAALLDEAARLILLRKVGGGYIFIHRYLLEYYASLEGKGEAEENW